MKRVAVIALLGLLECGVRAQSFISGTALYKERIALPSGAVFVGTLEDVSRVGAKAQELGRVTRYSVRARVTLDGRVLFTTDQIYPVLTGGAGHEVSMVMRRVAETPRQPAPAAGPPYFGEWRVTGFRIPGISAMTIGDAKKVVGTRASYSGTAAAFGANRCGKPSYQRRELSADDFMIEYRFPPKSLGLDGVATITLITITCTPDWSMQGVTLIVKSPSSIIATWDGAFFDLARQTR